MTIETRLLQSESNVSKEICRKYIRIRNTHATWGLLAARRAPLVLSCLKPPFDESQGEILWEIVPHGVLFCGGAEVKKYSYRASPKEIAENDFNLNIPRYVDTFELEEEIDVAAVQKDINRLEADLAKVRAKMTGYLKELGVDV